MLEFVSVVAVTCRQFGDTGKGKIVDIYAKWADIIARGTGGDNAGHSICVGDIELVVHIIPSGILYDSLGKINIIGSGVVLYPKSLILELKSLRDRGLSYNNLRLAYNAKLILPSDILLDRIREAMSGHGKIGSTGKGIGPAYADFVDRQSLMVNDLLNPTIFRAKLKRHLEYKKLILKNCDPKIIKSIMEHEHLESGLYYDPVEIFNFEAICEAYLNYGQELKPLISDTDKFLRENLGKKKILLEGAQGDMLSIDHGSYPFVTSSDCTVAGLAKGVGLKESDVDLSLGIIKGFYMTRVGCGPFVTESGAEESERWCNGGVANKELEKEKYGTPSINHPDDFVQGVALRQIGFEYGATTKRPRRTGWLDLPLLRYVLGFNSKDIVLTKLDILNDCKEIKICGAYEYRGGTCEYAGETIETGAILIKAIPDAAIMKYCKPIYKTFAGWQCDLSECQDFDDLPGNLKKFWTSSF